MLSGLQCEWHAQFAVHHACNARARSCDCALCAPHPLWAMYPLHITHTAHSAVLHATHHTPRALCAPYRPCTPCTGTCHTLYTIHAARTPSTPVHRACIMHAPNRVLSMRHACSTRSEQPCVPCTPHALQAPLCTMPAACMPLTLRVPPEHHACPTHTPRTPHALQAPPCSTHAPCMLHE